MMTDEERARPIDKPTLPPDRNGYAPTVDDIGKRFTLYKRLDDGQDQDTVAVYVGTLTGFEYIPMTVHTHNLNEVNNGQGPIAINKDDPEAVLPDFIQKVIGKAMGADEDGNMMHSEPEHIRLYLDDCERVIDVTPSTQTWEFKFEDDFGL